ncbi:hypothetical protein KAH94_03755 [bacterium]|nr:hypothetical protein [bacterium]
MKGGKAFRKPDKLFNKKQLIIGTKIEMEHTNSRVKAKQIAKDHLIESPRYYIELRKMEKKLDKEKTRKLKFKEGVIYSFDQKGLREFNEKK